MRALAAIKLAYASRLYTGQLAKRASQDARGRSWKQPRRWTGPSGSSTSKVDSKKCLTERERQQVRQRRRLIPKSASQSVRGRSWIQPRRWTGPSGSSTSKVDSKKGLIERERQKLSATVTVGGEKGLIERERQKLSATVTVGGQSSAGRRRSCGYGRKWREKD